MSPLAPFVYPNNAHVRQHDPQGYDNYGTYKQWLRDEFSFRCVYCLERERWSLSFEDSFSVEHVIPKKKKPDLECVYTNLVYACLRCNSNKQLAHLLDPCQEALGKHIVVQSDMTLSGLTAEGRKLVDALYLNDGPALHNRLMYHTIFELFQEEPTNPRYKQWLFADSCGWFLAFWQCTGEYLQPEILLVVETVGPSLEGADLVVQPLHESEGDFVVCVTVGHDAVPVILNHRRELLIGFEPLPFERVAPVVEEATCPAGDVVVPQLSEGFLEHVRRVQSLVDREEQFQRLTALLMEVLPARQQVVLLPFDEAAAVSREASVLGFADGIERVGEVSQDVELVVDEPGLRGVAGLERGGAEGFPHVEDDQTNSPGFPGSEPSVERIEAGFGTVDSAEPDGPAAEQIADDDAVGVAGADGEFVDADDLRSGLADAIELFAHVLFVEFLDGVPVEVEVLGDILDGGEPAVASDADGEASGRAGVVGEPVESFAFHGAAHLAEDAPAGELQVDAPPAAVEVADLARVLIVEGPMVGSTHSAGSFFRRRLREMTTAKGSPNMP
jgi:hypothetical protein